MAKYSYNHRTRTIDTETRCVAMVDDNSMTSHIIAELNTLATENEALHARVAELEAERDQWKEAAISENKLSVERWEEVAKWKHDYFAMRDTLLDIPEYVNWVTDGSDYENVTAPDADDSVFAPIANGDVCVFCYHSFDDPCENHPTCQDTGNPYAADDDTEPVEVVKPLDSEPYYYEYDSETETYLVISRDDNDVCTSYGTEWQAKQKVKNLIATYNQRNNLTTESEAVKPLDSDKHRVGYYFFRYIASGNSIPTMRHAMANDGYAVCGKHLHTEQWQEDAQVPKCQKCLKGIHRLQIKAESAPDA